jgi:NinB protein
MRRYPVKYHGILHNAQQADEVFARAREAAKPWLVAGHKLELRLVGERRNSGQNARLWAMLTDVSKQVEWYGRKLSPEEWKHVFSSNLRKLDAVPNLDGTGFVVLGLSTSSMTKREFSDLIELIASFGAERGVVFLEPTADE